MLLAEFLAERLSDVIPDRERRRLEMMMIELPSCVNSTAGRGLIIHDLLGLSVHGRGTH